MKNLLYILCLTSLTQNLFAQTDLSKLSYQELDSLMVSAYLIGDYENAINYTQAGRTKAKIEFGSIDSLLLLCFYPHREKKHRLMNQAHGLLNHKKL